MKLCIDPGHGGSDSGGTGYGRKEKNIVLNIALDLAGLAKDAGLEVVLTRAKDADVSISTRYEIANRWGADLFMSIHTNASGGRGIECLYGKSRDYLLAAYMAEELHRVTGWPIRREDGTWYRPHVGVLRGSSMPAVLSECGFIDYPEESASMDDPAWIRKVAQAHLEIACQFLGIEKGEEDEMVSDFLKNSYPAPKVGEPGGALAGVEVDVYEAMTRGGGHLFADSDLAGDVPLVIYAKPITGPNEEAGWISGGFLNKDNVHGTFYPLKSLFGELQGEHFITVHIRKGYPFRGCIVS